MLLITEGTLKKSYCGRHIQSQSISQVFVCMGHISINRESGLSHQLRARQISRP